jgi:hypothetical protein
MLLCHLQAVFYVIAVKPYIKLIYLVSVLLLLS